MAPLELSPRAVRDYVQDQQNLEDLVAMAVSQAIQERAADGALRVAELLMEYHSNQKRDKMLSSPDGRSLSMFDN
ncbi:hypothetical protein AB1Y20_014809 [Prymnesium parvum]|uniref:Uncharacterized protein n=1 Tax=Prymnesium parvum TaxID=97485 RepID=A0AB34IEE9_PRYPA